MHLEVHGGKEIKGTIHIKGAKNIAVALLPALLLNPGNITLTNVPNIEDVNVLINILNEIGIRTNFSSNTISINKEDIVYKELLFDDVSKLRGSYYFMGVMLSLFDKCDINYPGGCKLGIRPINYHLKAFEALGYKVECNDFIKIRRDIHKDNVDIFCHASVGTTINALLACFNKEMTVNFYSPSLEFEVLEVIRFLKELGADIDVLDNKLVYRGTKLSNTSITHMIAFDRMEALSYAALAAIGGDLTLEDVDHTVMKYPLEIIEKFGAIVYYSHNSVRVVKNKMLGDIHIKTDLYPGFPTDVQQPFTTMLLYGEKPSSIEETIYSDRFSHIEELKKMGANLTVVNNVILIEPSRLHACVVEGKDLRGTFALYMACMCTDGVSVLNGYQHILRGYCNIK